MAPFGLLTFACYCFFYQLQQVVAPPPATIEAYKPSTDSSSNVQESNSGFGDMAKLNKMLKKYQHKIDDINVRRRMMEAQMKSPFNFQSGRMAAAFSHVDTSTPSAMHSRRIMSNFGATDGVFLQIFPDGTVNGTRDISSPLSK